MNTRPNRTPRRLPLQALQLLLPALATAAALLTHSPEVHAQAAPAPSADATTPADGDCLGVEVRGVTPRTGHLMVAAYGSEAGFGKQALAQTRVDAGDATTVLKLCGLGAHRGPVALMAFQDLDGDGRMGRNAIGIPTEPWGSSGKAGTFGPNWAGAAVTPDGRAVVVQLVR